MSPSSMLLIVLVATAADALDLRECNRPLGMESGAIRSNQLSASSSHDAESTGPQHARVRTETGSGAWCPANQIGANASNEWIQISFPHEVVFTAVETQGRFDGGSGKEFAHFYRVEYWRDAIGRWASVRLESGSELFAGNRDTRSAEMAVIGGGVVASGVRVRPVSNRTITVCMRIELYGCVYKDELLSYSAPQGAEADGLSMKDERFDGERRVTDAGDVILVEGLGKLYDGVTGQENFERHPSAWLGWRRRSESDHERDMITLNFTFASPRNLSSIILYTSNMLKYNAQMFPEALVEFSVNGRDFSRRTFHIRFAADPYSTARWVRLDVRERFAKAIMLHLTLPKFPNWLLISEAKFESGKAAFPVPEEPPLPDHIEFSSGVHYPSIVYDMDGRPVTESPEWDGGHVLMAAGVLALLGATALAAAICCRRGGGRVKSAPSPVSAGSSAAAVCYPSKAVYQVMMDGGTIKHISPSTYEMAKDNAQNARLELGASTFGAAPTAASAAPTSSDGEYSSEYADPDVSCCSDEFSTMPLLHSRASHHRSGGSSAAAAATLPAIGRLSWAPAPAALTHSMHYASSDLFATAAKPPLSQLLLQAAPFENANDQDEDEENTHEAVAPGSLSPLSSRARYAVYERLYATTLPEIARSQLHFIERIGHGEFGEVHLCRLEKRRVAVKMLNGRRRGVADAASSTSRRPSFSGAAGTQQHGMSSFSPEMTSSSTFRASPLPPSSDQSSLTSEAELAFEREMRVLGALRHPNVVEVIGVCTRERPLACVMEFMENGDVKRYMQRHPDIDAATALSMCTQIAAGMSYLESQGFVHRDLAARNCLLDAECAVKIGDFGMARSLYADEYYQVQGGPRAHRLPVRWMAPECLLLGKFSSKSDVWAFGVTVWELLGRCASLPYSAFSHEQCVQNVRVGHETGSLQAYLSRPPLCSQSLYRDLLLPCWATSASARPPFQTLHLFLQSMQHNAMR